MKFLCMSTDPDSSFVQLKVADPTDIEEVILAFRKDGELQELASMEPPVRAELKKPGP